MVGFSSPKIILYLNGLNTITHSESPTKSPCKRIFENVSMNFQPPEPGYMMISFQNKGHSQWFDRLNTLLLQKLWVCFVTYILDTTLNKLFVLRVKK